MRAILIVAVFALSFTTFSANADRKPASLNKKAARMECKKDNPGMKGKALKKCVKEKMQ
jgi:hypothetical protein